MLILTTTFTAPITMTFYVTEDGDLTSRKELSKVFTTLEESYEYLKDVKIICNLSVRDFYTECAVTPRNRGQFGY